MHDGVLSVDPRDAVGPGAFRSLDQPQTQGTAKDPGPLPNGGGPNPALHVVFAALCLLNSVCLSWLKSHVARHTHVKLVRLYRYSHLSFRLLSQNSIHGSRWNGGRLKLIGKYCPVRMSMFLFSLR